VYSEIVPDTWVAIVRPNKAKSLIITKVLDVQSVTRTDYNFPARVTRLILKDAWLDASDQLLSDVRSTTVYAAPEPLALANEPVDHPICGAEIELDRQIDGLQPGRWLLITGERAAAATANPPRGGKSDADDFPVKGVSVSELVMLAGVRQDTLYVQDGKVVPPSEIGTRGGTAVLPGDKVHTFLQLATPLSYCYKQGSVTIYANIAHATHGETRQEVLGSGDGKQAFQSFSLKSPPLTYVATPNPSGVDSTLNLYVNDVRWHEAEDFLDLGPTDRGYVTHADASGKVTVTFGDGLTGARLPNGTENVRAVYRTGIGQPGNVRLKQLSQLVANTDGLRSVTNPQEASGGANPDGLESTRSRAPLAVAALDRLVATVDYADFARLFAGIAKASASRLPSTHGEVVQVTVAGQDDIPIDVTSDLYRNLLLALEQNGDPNLPLRLVHRELRVLVISARVRLRPDYLWDKVRPQTEAALWNRFGFDQRTLGQDAYAAEAVAAMQAVLGVEYVDLDLFGAVSESIKPSDLANLATILSGVADRIAALRDRVEPKTLKPLPAQLVMLSPSLPTTLMLTEVPRD
jgi:predicted phage baseplate assembly protein